MTPVRVDQPDNRRRRWAVGGCGPPAHRCADGQCRSRAGPRKDDAADVARVGFDAMMRGDGDVVSGWKNKLQSAIANVTPAGVLAEQHRRMAEAGSGKRAG